MATYTDRENQEGENELFSLDIIAVATGIANKAMARRVWARSVSDASVRYRFALSLSSEDEEEQITDAISQEISEVVPEHLQHRTKMISEKFVKVPMPPPRSRLLDIKETLLHLPCFAPAVAAPDQRVWSLMSSQTIMTHEGVRVEFQQFATISVEGKAKPLLRIIVDSSILDIEKERYINASLTMWDGDKVFLSFTIPLNAQGRGLLDVETVPPAESVYRLVSVNLTTE